jgi:hypothetical protein
VKTSQNSQPGKVSNAVLSIWSRAVQGLKSFCGLEACIFLTNIVSFFQLHEAELWVTSSLKSPAFILRESLAVSN